MRSDLIATIDLQRLAHNVATLRGHCRPQMQMCVVVKADAYCHGASLIVPELARLGVEMLAVATIPEGIQARGLGWNGPILVLGHVLSVASQVERRERIDALLEHRLTATICFEDIVVPLAAAAAARGVVADVHLAIDTGMGREGVMPDAAAELVTAILRRPSLRITGIYSHFATADLVLHDLAERQLGVFQGTLEKLRGLLPPGATRHLSNTAATLAMPAAHFDMVRPGIGVYGCHPVDSLAAESDLLPILRLTSHLTLVKTLPVGHCVGYGQTFVTRRPTRIGIVPMGYTDGFIRFFSNNATIGTEAGDVPVIGRISMDQLAVDLTDVPSVGVGAEVTLIDDDPRRPNSIATLARQIGTIPYEVMCLLGHRVDRVRKAAAPERTPPPVEAVAVSQ